LLHTWTGLADLDVEKIDENACQEWASKYLKEYSATRFNGTLSVLRSILAIAVKAGARYGNPALQVKRAKVKPKKLHLPSRKKFLELVRTIESAHGRFSKDCADFVRFLAFTGCRKNEAKNVTWGDIDFKKGTIQVRGDEVTGTKNGDPRPVYFFPELKALLQRLKEKVPQAKSTDKVLRVSEAQKAIDRAAKLVGIARITHHDLRHLYATTLIEHGTDIPTVARMLGHKDGGALAMKTYGHLRDEHAKKSIRKVRFA